MVIGSLATRRLPNPNSFCRNAQSLISFSTSSGGRGRGRADGSPPQFSFSARYLGQPDSSAESESSTLGRGGGGAYAPQDQPPPTDSGLGRGHGHGRLPPPHPVRHSFAGRGRGGSTSSQLTEPSRGNEDGGDSVMPGQVRKTEQDSVNVISALDSVGFGRGQPLKSGAQAPDQEVNRHIRPQSQGQRSVNQNYRNQAQPGPGEAPIQEVHRDDRYRRHRSEVQSDMNQSRAVPSSSKSAPRPKMSREDAVKNAKKILSSKGDDEEEDGFKSPSRGRKGRGRFRERDHSFVNDDDDSMDNNHSMDRFKDADEEYDAEAEKEMERRCQAMKEMVGPEMYEQLQEAFDEVVEENMPDEELVEAHDLNFKFAPEPEHAMTFNENPDIDETQPLPLGDTLEKVNPFVMTYDGIQSQEEWEEAMKQTKKHASLLKKLVDPYSGPGRVTAKQQVEELEGISQTLPQGASASVKRFTDRALLSLQSNPGWAFEKKAQFMKKLVGEFSQRR